VRESGAVLVGAPSFFAAAGLAGKSRSFFEHLGIFTTE
jgi:hypothetical protein